MHGDNMQMVIYFSFCHQVCVAQGGCPLYTKPTTSQRNGYVAGGIFLYTGISNACHLPLCIYLAQDIPTL